MKISNELENKDDSAQPASGDKAPSRDTLKKPEIFSKIITQNPKMLKMFHEIEEGIGNSLLPVLITGETGTGKDLLAEVIHKASGRKGDPIPAKVGGLSDEDFSQVVFGYVDNEPKRLKKDYKGLVGKAKNGTLFFDEIADITLQSQVRLFPLIDEMEDYLNGRIKKLTANVRIIAATNRNLKSMEKEGEFRNDLYSRLHHKIEIPELKKRKEDIPLLLEHFLILSSKRLKKQIPTIPKELVTLLESYDFPGNVRELAGMVYEALSLNISTVLSLETFEKKIREQKKKKVKKIIFNGDFPDFEEMKEIYLAEALKRSPDIKAASLLTGLAESAFKEFLEKKK